MFLNLVLFLKTVFWFEWSRSFVEKAGFVVHVEGEACRVSFCCGRLLRPWNDSGHCVITAISLLLECIFPSIKTFHFALSVPSVELNGFRHLFASVGFICLLDLHPHWNTIKDFDLQNTDVNKEKTKETR